MQCVFAIVLALLMERPLMFWSDLPGKLPSYNVTAPSAPSLRISPAHFTEPFGSASAIFERRLNDLGGFGGFPPSFPGENSRLRSKSEYGIINLKWKQLIKNQI